MFHEVAEVLPDTPHAASDVLCVGALTLRVGERTVECKGRSTQLSPKEVALLEMLMHNRGHVYTRGALFEQLYGRDSERSDKVIEVVMSTLRSKLTSIGANELIETRRGYGYVVPWN